jgi:hypothetical protein
MTGVGEEWAFNRDSLSVVLVGPSGIVAVAADGKFQICIKGRSVRLSIILKSNS